MAKNQVFYHGEDLSVIVTNPTNPLSGQPCRMGSRTGVCTTDEASAMSGNPAGYTSVKFGPAGWSLAVQAPVGGVNPGDRIFYHDGAGAAAGTLDTVAAAGYFFGYALDAIAASQLATIRVQHVENTQPVGV